MVEIGNFALDRDIPSQIDSRLTWDVISNKDRFYLNRRADGVKTVGYSYFPMTPILFMWTDLNIVQGQFQRATYYKDSYDYGAFLFNEELGSPIVSASWFGAKHAINTWYIDGSIVLGGVTLELIRTWHTRVYGTWDSVWWESVKINNTLTDPKIKAWNAYYVLQILKAWKGHMTSLGKGTALVMWPLWGILPDDQQWMKEVYTSSGWSYILSNYDVIFTYKYPNSLTTTDMPNKIYSTLYSEAVVKGLRTVYNGTIIHILTNCWADKSGCPWSEAVAFDEFKRVKGAGADVIVFMPSADMSAWNPFALPYFPYIYKFVLNSLCPPSQCDFTITQ